MTLPRAFQGAIEAWLAREASGSRREGTRGLSATYRKGGSSADVDLAAYLVARLPATFAAVSRVLQEVHARRPGFSPASLLDAGSGPGTASWAAAEIWPGIKSSTFLDTSAAFLDMARVLAENGPPPLSEARKLPGSIETIPEEVEADLVIAAYALAELPIARMAGAARNLWTASRSMLVLVEPGTPQGFARLRTVRDVLISQGAVPVAPCPHAGTCPMVGEDWCHFSVRLARSRAHMHAKGASVPFEDEKFAYLVLAREGAISGGARVLTPPVHTKPGIDVRLCTGEDAIGRHIARRDGAAYKRYRKLDWGDFLDPAEENGT